MTTVSIGPRNVAILPTHQARCELDNRDLAAEATEDLRKLKADTAAAENNQMRGQKVHLHRRTTRQVADVIKTGDRRHEWATSNVNEDFFGDETLGVDLNRAWLGEACMALVNRASFEVSQPVFDAFA